MFEFDPVTVIPEVVPHLGERDENGLVCDADGSCFYSRPAPLEPELPELIVEEPIVISDD